eukprot:6185136-Pleurochrysis_carterae.AAC.1
MIAQFQGLAMIDRASIFPRLIVCNACVLGICRCLAFSRPPIATNANCICDLEKPIIRAKKICVAGATDAQDVIIRVAKYVSVLGIGVGECIGIFGIVRAREAHKAWMLHRPDRTAEDANKA